MNPPPHVIGLKVKNSAMASFQPSPSPKSPGPRARRPGCSLTESLDENHASYVHFGGSEFYLAAAEQNTSL